MDYILQNWSELNLMDRVWFLMGIWLGTLFIVVFSMRIYRWIYRKINPIR